MILNNSLGSLQEGVSSPGRLIRPHDQKRQLLNSRFSLGGRLGQSGFQNDSLTYSETDVIMSERTLGYETLMPINNTYLKLDPAVAKQKTDLLFDDFCTIAQSRTSDAEIFDSVQDIIVTCSDAFDDIIRNGGRLNERNVFDGFGWLNQERNTWKLLHCLYKDRVLGQRATDADSYMTDLWMHSSEKEHIDKLYEQHQNLREYQLIVDWLEQCASDQHYDKCRHFTDETISWENTLHQLQNLDRTVFGSGKAIVQKMDPDAPLRENAPLHDLDMEDEQRISKQVNYTLQKH